ncbi:MAG TPA: hypothetical protein ENN69_05800, partial [Spirochaetia bacterium]|nr:hypothetical protein [Spirochaetia bacterium]
MKRTIFIVSLVTLGSLSGCQSPPLTVTDWRDAELPATPEDVAARIREHRTGPVTLTLTDKRGRPLPE